MHPQIKTFRLLKISCLVTLFAAFLDGFALVHDQTKQTGKDTRATDSQLINAVVPGLSGVSYSSYAKHQQNISFKAERVSLDNRRFEGHILNFCKDIVISDLQVRIRSQQLENVMDWAYNSHLDSITSALFFDHRLILYNEISNINIRFVAQPLRVNLIPYDGEGPRFSIYADSMFKESASEVVTFKGNFRLFLNDRELIVSQLVKWNPDKRRFLFPAGFVTPNSTYSNRLAVKSNKYITLAEINGLLAQNKPIQAVTPGQTFAKKIDRKGKRRDGIPVSLDFEQISKNLKKVDKDTQKMIVLELLATNPGILKQAGLSPALLLFPNFKLGAFEPGPFFTGLGM